METPHRWIVLCTSEGMEKVLMGWNGGYLDADYWRINSGIVAVQDEGDAYVFVGRSGSQYRCFKDRFGATGLSGSILSQLLELPDVSVVARYRPLIGAADVAAADPDNRPDKRWPY